MEEPQQQTAWSETPAAASALVEKWLLPASASFGDNTRLNLLETARRDGDSVAFSAKLLQLIADTDDVLLAALGLRRLAQEMPQTLPRREKIALKAGSLGAVGVPWAVLPIAKRWLRDRVSHLVCTAQLPGETTRDLDPHLAAMLTDLEAQHTPAQVALTGEAVLGPAGAHRELRRLLALLQVPHVTHLLVDFARLAPGDSFGSDARIKRAVAALRQLILAGAAHGASITITAASYADSKLAASCALKLLADPELTSHSFGITLPAENPESAELVTTLAVHTAARKKHGGPAPEVRVSVESTASAESINSLLTGLPLPVLEKRAQIEAAALRLLSQAAAAGLKPVFACDSPYIVAAALVRSRGQAEPLTVEVRSGISAELVLALTADRVSTRVQLPLVTPGEFSAAVPYLLHLTAQAADERSALNRQRLLESDYLPAAEHRYAEQQHLNEVCELAAEPATPVQRTQDRGREWDPSARDSALFYRPADDPSARDTGGLTAAVLGLNTDPDTGELVLEDALLPRTVPVVSDSGFAAEPGTDMTRPSNRDWFRTQLALGTRAREAAATPVATATAEVATATKTAPETVPSGGAARARGAGSTLSSRSRVLKRLALTTVANRDRLTQLFAASTHLTAAQIDSQINELIDAARFLAQQAEGLERVRGATFGPAGPVLISCDDSNLVATALTTLLAEYAAGNPVTLVLPDSCTTLAAELITEWQGAGLPQQAVTLEATAPAGLAAHTARLAASRQQTGSSYLRATTVGTDKLRRSLLRSVPGLTVNNRSHQLGVATITPAADYNDAARDIVLSAFTGDDSGLRRVKAVITVGSSSRAERFKTQLADAVRAIVASPEHATDPLQNILSPLPAPPTQAQLSALTELARGETWLVTPRKLDDSGLLWSPGVKAGISPGSDFWRYAYELPLIGITAARSLAEAVEISNTLGSGAVASLYSWDPTEIVPWLNSAAAASLTVNRPSCGARVERLPSGTWRGFGSSIAPLSGGPHQLLTLGSWQLREGTPSSTLHLRGLEPEIALLIETAQEWLSYAEFDRLRRAALADALTWRTQLGVVRDVSGLGVEHNVLRYWPVPSQIRMAENAPVEQLVRVLSAALLVRAPVTVSTGVALPAQLAELLARQDVTVRLESDEYWLETVAVNGPAAGFDVAAERIRLIGGDTTRLAEWLAERGDIAVWAAPVTMAGPVELLSFLREQSVSLANHRGQILAQQPEIAAWLRELGR